MTAVETRALVKALLALRASLVALTAVTEGDAEFVYLAGDEGQRLAKEALADIEAEVEREELQPIS